jgi:cell wall-associated NlpC family hydrolase
MTTPTPDGLPPVQTTTGGIGNSAANSSGSMSNLNPTTGIGNAAGSHSQLGSDPTQANISADSQPQQMKTLIYSPDVRVIIAHGAKQYDVSADIVRCSLHRAESSAASFFMTLSNKGLRYTPRNGKPTFSRMDRIIVYMKRTGFTQVFSGYLDTVPYKQLYPGTVDFKATCTLKRLLHTWWNPALPKSNALLNLELSPDQFTATDRGLGAMVRRILTLVGGWKTENIHIQNFPTAFFDFMTAQVTKNQSVNDAAVEKFKHMLLGDNIAAGPGSAASYNASAGLPGPVSPVGVGGAAGAAGAIGTGGIFYIQQIIAACDERGMGPLVTDNDQGAALNQVGTTAAGSRDQATQKAGQQLQQSALDQQNANRNSDAAIIAVGVSAVETGGGVTLNNWANPSVAGSNKYGSYPPYPCDLDSCGLFQQRNLPEWGSVDQRMNPKQSAGMFLDHLKSMVPDWRNMDPAAAAQQVQRGASANQAKYATAISAFATPQVQAIRTAAGATNTATGALGSSIPGASSLGGGGAPSLSPGAVTGVSGVTPAATGIGSSVDPMSSQRPNPDSEGALNFMLSKCGNTPYVWGGKGPSSYDCSGLVSAAFASLGIKIPSQTDAIRAAVTQIPKSQAGRGDIYEPHSSHVTLLLGPPGPGSLLVSAATSQAPLPRQIRVEPWYSGSGEWYGRACANGGPDPTSPYNPSAMAGSGSVPPGALDQQGGVGGSAGAGLAGTSGGGGAALDEPIARNLFSYMFTGQFANDTATYWPPEKAFLDGQPLIQMIKAICGASLREFQSAPNGDFMAYYPDWWGLDGKPAVYQLEDIELKDVKIDYSDDNLTTHVYIEGTFQQIGQADSVAAWLDTAGVATVEDTWLYARLIKVAPGDPESASGDEIMRRYGIRPLKQEYAMAGSHELELLLACQVFMQKWAEQFQTQVSITFMPELMPGMRILLKNHNLTVYVTEVVHTCDFEQGFSTSATIMAPANPNARDLMSQVGGTFDASANPSVSKGFTDPVLANDSGGGVTIPGAGPIG